MGTELPDQSLGYEAIRRIREVFGPDSHSEKARYRSGRAFGMDGRKYQMSGYRRLNGDIRRFLIPHLSDHDDIGILSQERPESFGK